MINQPMKENKVSIARNAFYELAHQHALRVEYTPGHTSDLLVVPPTLLLRTMVTGQTFVSSSRTFDGSCGCALARPGSTFPHWEAALQRLELLLKLGLTGDPIFPLPTTKESL